MNNKIFVKNLSKGITESMLYEFISKSGTVKSVAIFEETKFENPGTFALAEMGSPEEAAKTIKMLNGNILNGREIYVIEANPMEIPNTSVK